MEESGFAATRGFARGAFVDQSLRNQLLHQDTDHSPSHVQAPRQVRAGNRLVLANEVKGNTAIYVARGRTSGDMKVSSVYLADDLHLSIVRGANNIPDWKCCQEVFKFLFFGSRLSG